MATKLNAIEELRANNDGQLPTIAWPGGYPLYYLAEDGTVFCADCANQTDAEPPITAYDVNWEDCELYCDGCNKRIESAYGEEDCPEYDK